MIDTAVDLTVSPPKYMHQNLNPTLVLLGGKTFGKRLGHKDGALINEISDLRALTGMAHLVEQPPTKGKIIGLIPGQGMCWGLWAWFLVGVHGRGN